MSEKSFKVVVMRHIYEEETKSKRVPIQAAEEEEEEEAD